MFITVFMFTCMACAHDGVVRAYILLRCNSCCSALSDCFCFPCLSGFVCVFARPDARFAVSVSRTSLPLPLPAGEWRSVLGLWSCDVRAAHVWGRAVCLPLCAFALFTCLSHFVLR